jgi:hypothetical protein
MILRPIVVNGHLSLIVALVPFKVISLRNSVNIKELNLGTNESKGSWGVQKLEIRVGESW